MELVGLRRSGLGRTEQGEKRSVRLSGAERRGGSGDGRPLAGLDWMKAALADQTVVSRAPPAASLIALVRYSFCGVTRAD